MFMPILETALTKSIVSVLSSTLSTIITKSSAQIIDILKLRYEGTSFFNFIKNDPLYLETEAIIDKILPAVSEKGYSPQELSSFFLSSEFAEIAKQIYSTLLLNSNPSNNFESIKKEISLLLSLHLNKPEEDVQPLPIKCF